MKKTSSFFLLFFLLSFFAFSQSGSIKGQAVGGDSPLIAATVSLLQAQDSSLVLGASADVDGNFETGPLRNGTYLLKISYLGFQDLFRKVSVAGLPVNVGTLTLTAASTTLREVEVVGRAATVITRGDTTELNAAAFKVNQDASAENLLQKMPGITVTNGQVQAQGEKVQRVLVDGKEFFGEDPSAVLKNLPAEVISKIQVFDKQSDQAQFTGFNDGNEQKTINIITKPEYRTGQFGRFSAGIGTDSRYRLSGNLNRFNGDQRISILGLSNNVNEQNFSSEDLVGVASASSRGGRGRGGRGGGNWGGGNSTGDFLVNTNRGIAKTNAIGLNYLDKLGKKVDVQASYFFNHSNTESNYALFREYGIQENQESTYAEDGNADSRNQNHRANARITYTIDSANSIIFRPRLSLQTNNGSSDLTGNTISGSPMTSLINTFSSELTGLNFNNNILFRHSFPKRGRTISLDVSTGYNQNDGDNQLYSLTTTDARVDEDDWVSTLDNQGLNLGASLNYTEPLTQNTQLQLSYGTNYSTQDGDQRTFEKAEGSPEYDKLLTNQSSTVENNNITQQFGTGWRYNSKEVMVVLNARYQYLNMQTDQLYPSVLKKDYNYHNVLPFAMVRYNLTPDRNIRAFYHGRSQTPQISQLQSAIDKSSSLLWRQGNPDLGQSFAHNVTFRYTSANPEKSSSFFLVLGGSVNQNYIGQQTFTRASNALLPTEDQLIGNGRLIKPVNLDGQYNLRSFMTYGLPITALKSNLNLNLSATYSNTPALLDLVENNSSVTNTGAGLVLSSNISENLDFLIGTNASYNQARYSYLQQQDNNYYNQSSQFRLNWVVWKGLNLTSELNHQYNGGLADGIDKTYLLWNGSIGYKLLKDRRAEIKLSAFDILGENTSIQQNIESSYREDVQTSVLQRYFMLSFNYNLRQFAGAGKESARPTRPEGGHRGH